MALLRCDKCQTVLPGAVVNTGTLVACPACGVSTLVQVFPAFSRAAPRGRAAEALTSAEDASCFYHPSKKAAVPCDRCGRFLCTLCDLELDGRHVCPECIEVARKSGQTLRSDGRTLHDQVALTLAVLGPLLIGWGSIITAPIALFMVARYWNEPRRSPVPRGRWRLVAAGTFALLQTGAWLFLLYSFLTNAAWLK